MKREKKTGNSFSRDFVGDSYPRVSHLSMRSECIPFFPPAENALPGEKDIASPPDEAKAFSLSHSHHMLFFHR